MTAYEILKSFYRDPLTIRAVESAAKRTGRPCLVTDNPTNGVVVIFDDANPTLVELDEGEKTLLLVAVGKAFAKLVRM